jgi:hypothetical protein
MRPTFCKTIFFLLTLLVFAKSTTPAKAYSIKTFFKRSSPGDDNHTSTSEGFLEKRRIRKEEERKNSVSVYYTKYQLETREKKKTDRNIRLAAHTISFVNTGLLFYGGLSAVYPLGASMIALKLLSYITYENDLQNGVSSKAWVSLFFSGAAFCFKSRAMELSGATILTFIQFMAL